MTKPTVSRKRGSGVTTDSRTIFDDTFSKTMRSEIWTANYLPAIPFTPQGFDIGAVLPAMLYMMRWGTRRGQGQFRKTFSRAASKKNKITVGDIAWHMTQTDAKLLEGFGDTIGQHILGDLLLAYCFENQKHEEGQNQPVQRIYPAHYMASWVDLPETAANQRGIPELLVAILVQQNQGSTLDPQMEGSHYPLATGFKENELLRVFGRNMVVPTDKEKLDRGLADVFDEARADEVGIDELLAIRIAQACKRAPEPAAKAPQGGEERKAIPNQKPLPRKAARQLHTDLKILIEVYGGSIPRQAFLQLFEAAVSLNLTNLLLSTLAMLLCWEKKGRLPSVEEQNSWPLFVDCSNGQEKSLQAWSENSFSEMLRRYERLPLLTMLLRVLDFCVSGGDIVLPTKAPDATEFINFLGEFLHKSHAESGDIVKELRKHCKFLATGMEKTDPDLDPDLVCQLRNEAVPELYRFAESILKLMSKENQWKKYKEFLESCLTSGKPSGLSRKRISSEVRDGKRAKVELSSIVLTPVMLDFLVHRHLRKAEDNEPKFLSLQEFLKILRNDYGLHIDQSPRGMTIPQTDLDANVRWLERRLRDLGLLIGVNDAPSMKQLRARYPSRQDTDDVAD